jgi:two-component system, chemotaxis family, chemotaxis protein CheY
MVGCGPRASYCTMRAERILVVDDDESIRQIVRLCLSDEGYDVQEAPNGQAALDTLSVVRPDLILLDLRMPVMDGWEFAKLYADTPKPHAPIVAFVAALNAEQECADLPAAAILTKPFDLDDLLRAVRTQLPLAR